MDKIHLCIKNINEKIEKDEFNKAFEFLLSFLNNEQNKNIKDKSIIEILILITQEIIQSEKIEEQQKKILSSKIYLLLEGKNIYTNAFLQNEHDYNMCDYLKNEIFENFVKKKKKLKVLQEYAPKFYMKGDKREFNQKLEMKNLKKKNRKIKKKLEKELQVETDLMQEKNKNKHGYFVNQKKKVLNQTMNELQKQQKIIERENTSVVKHHRIKKVKKRKAGN
jgi:hypothetical protein